MFELPVNAQIDTQIDTQIEQCGHVDVYAVVFTDVGNIFHDIAGLDEQSINKIRLYRLAVAMACDIAEEGIVHICIVIRSDELGSLVIKGGMMGAPLGRGQVTRIATLGARFVAVRKLLSQGGVFSTMPHR